MYRKALHSVLAVAALASVGSSALAATMMANNSNKGSALVFPRIDVRAGTDTLITLVNDSSTAVHVKCYYRASDPLPTPLPSTFNTAFIKHTMDFTLTLTRNQPITWSAATGLVLGGLSSIAAPFTSWPDGAMNTTGELKCFAIGTDANGNVTQINFNQLFGSATIVGAPFGNGDQAYQYNAWAFQALGGTLAQGQPVGSTPGVLNLDGTITGYDMCPNILVTAFEPPGAPQFQPFTGNSAFQLSIAACNQDLTQRAQPFITKYTYTFWNEDEFSRTGTHECGDSYYELALAVTFRGDDAPPLPFPIANMPLALFSSLGTQMAYMRIESIADPFVCANAVQFGMLGVFATANNRDFVRGTNFIGRGTRAGQFTFDPGPADSFKR